MVRGGRVKLLGRKTSRLFLWASQYRMRHRDLGYRFPGVEVGGHDGLIALYAARLVRGARARTSKIEWLRGTGNEESTSLMNGLEP